MSKRSIRKRRHRRVRSVYQAASLRVVIGGHEFTVKEVTYRESRDSKARAITVTA